VRRRLEQLGAEDGFTLIEVLVASIVLVVGLLALLVTFDHARDLTSGSERSAQAIRVAERELERLMAVPYNSLAQNSALSPPSTCTQTSSIASSYAPGTAVAVSGGAATPVATWSVTRMGTTSSVRGCLYVFVRWANDPSCSDAKCPGQQDFKRLTVAASVTMPDGTPIKGGPSKPVIVSAVKANPRIGPGGLAGTPAPFIQ
jgi:prepilin-type N-terminal cleavage/methylation domain-containing protein